MKFFEDKLKINNLGLVLILILYSIYAGIFIFQSSFVHEGERIFILFDDATISLQYARNLANGNGIVWNAGGEYIEGYTNPLWVVYMAFFHLFPIPISKMALCIQISGAIFVLISLIFVKKISAFLSNNNIFITLLSVFSTAFYYPISNWSLLGTEVSILILLTLIVVWLSIQSLEGNKFKKGVYIILGLTLLIRMDMVVSYIIIWVFLIIFNPQNRMKHVLWGFLSLLVFLGGQTLFRYFYYGDLLPNTYYLKMTGMSTFLRIKRGLYVFAKFAWNLGPVFLVVPFLIFLFKRNKYIILLFLLFLGQCAYSVYVGGDAWEHRGGANRFIVLGIPFFLMLFTSASVYIFELIKDHSQAEFKGNIKKWVSRSVELVLILFVLFGLINFNTLLDGNSLKYWLLLQPTVYSPGSQRYAVDGIFVKKFTSPDAKILVGAAGNVAYFSERFSYDLMGKADSEIARQDVKIPKDLETLTFLRPGHYKYDYSISIGKYQPDVLVELKANTDEEFSPYLSGYKRYMVNNHAMYFRLDSEFINWDELNNYINSLVFIVDPG
ncbi:MAG: hypothetical protein CVU41_02990 [Chloroflexi bacterium HGW-Chloroflexi-3]|nr:MAG: hypothetical protein CVU41_02990 [Chloroflexi bacterium HGW-Chloroflexi-3]